VVADVDRSGADAEISTRPCSVPEGTGALQEAVMDAVGLNSQVRKAGGDRAGHPSTAVTGHLPVRPDTGGRGPLRVAMLAPPWIPVPPPGYGGIEWVVHLLCDGLVERGVQVTLFAAPGSHSRAEVWPVLPRTYPERIERALHEADHVARVFDEVENARLQGRPFDVIHDHCGFTAFAMADRISTPVVHTLHGPFDADTVEFYRHHASKAVAVAISKSQAAAAPCELRIAAVVPNPTDVDASQFSADKDDYVLWVGRMVPEKGPHRAIAAAKAAGVNLVLAAPVQPGQEEFFRTEVEPHVDGDRVRYLGEVGGAAKQRLFASARGLLMPIRWCEPFGMVMVEALSAGTPVIAFSEGAAPEIVEHGTTGYLVADEGEMASAIADLSDIDPHTCRARAKLRFGKAEVAARYEATYRAVIREQHLRSRLAAAPTPALLMPNSDS